MLLIDINMLSKLTRHCLVRARFSTNLAKISADASKIPELIIKGSTDVSISAERERSHLNYYLNEYEFYHVVLKQTFSKTSP